MTSRARHTHTRTCRKCGLSRPLDDYLPSAALPGGQIRTCRHCLAREVSQNKGAARKTRRPLSTSRGSR
jgi:hypothetical protein